MVALASRDSFVFVETAAHRSLSHKDQELREVRESVVALNTKVTPVSCGDFVMGRGEVGWKMRPKMVFLLVLALGVVGSAVTGVAATAEDVTDATATPLPAEDVTSSNVTSSNVTEEEFKDAVPQESALASEVADMMRDPYRPSAEDAEDDTEKTVDSDTVPVDDSHVVKENKTHESVSMLPNPEGQDSAVSSASSLSSIPASESPESSVSATPASSSAVNSTAVNGETSSTPSVKPDDESPGKSTGLSSISIVSVSRIAMSPPTEVAAILSMVLVVSAVAGYLGMLAWRKILEKRYGNREMLVNEDDDLRHFEL